MFFHGFRSSRNVKCQSQAGDGKKYLPDIVVDLNQKIFFMSSMFFHFSADPSSPLILSSRPLIGDEVKDNKGKTRYRIKQHTAINASNALSYIYPCRPTSSFVC